jgi:hypothetical protein
MWAGISGYDVVGLQFAASPEHEVDNFFLFLLAFWTRALLLSWILLTLHNFEVIRRLALGTRLTIFLVLVGILNSHFSCYHEFCLHYILWSHLLRPLDDFKFWQILKYLLKKVFVVNSSIKQTKKNEHGKLLARI